VLVNFSGELKSRSDSVVSRTSLLTACDRSGVIDQTLCAKIIEHCSSNILDKKIEKQAYLPINAVPEIAQTVLPTIYSRCKSEALNGKCNIARDCFQNCKEAKTICDDAQATIWVLQIATVVVVALIVGDVRRYTVQSFFDEYAERLRFDLERDFGGDRSLFYDVLQELTEWANYMVPFLNL
jgi:hypothetical protein